jgi:hypothetical protein
VQQLDTVVSVFFVFKLNEAEVLVFIGNFVAGQVHVNHGASLQK